jgi:hypothetical protein
MVLEVEVGDGQDRGKRSTQLYGPDILTPLSPDSEEFTAAAADTVCAWCNQPASRVTLLYLSNRV